MFVKRAQWANQFGDLEILGMDQCLEMANKLFNIFKTGVVGFNIGVNLRLLQVEVQFSESL